MAVTRLSEAQKQEVVARYRQGQSSTELAAAYDCSAKTVTRLVKATLDPVEYEQLKRQRSRGLRPVSLSEEPATVVNALDANVLDPVATVAEAPERADQRDQPDQPHRLGATGQGDSANFDDTANLDEEDDDEDGPGVLAIDDADDFGADGEDDGDAVLDDEGDDGEEAEGDDTFVTVPVHLGAAVEELVQCRAFSEARLPASAYLLVDRTVELQPLALSECPELGPLPEQEAERRALMLFVNPRQAKRHCGRSQRVIKLPDVSLLERTAPYLLAQGISRVVIKGGVYSLPGS